MNTLPRQIDSPWPHRLAMAVALATFPLIWVGGLVTTYEAGMAVPDWPNTYGYNLFLYPWQTWLFGPWDLFIEHGHRLLGAAVGLLTIGLCLALWFADARPWAKWLGLVALAGVISQGLLGGMRVMLDERVLARVHGCLGPAFFAFAAGLAVVTSRRWRSDVRPETVSAAGKIQRLALLTTALVFLQLVIGAHLRHPSLSWSPSVFQAIVVFHVLLALAIAGHVLSLFARSRRIRAVAAITRPTLLLVVLVFAQIALGGLTWLENYGWLAGAESYAVAAGHTVHAQSQLQALVTTAHVAVGSLIVATAVVVSLNAFRWLAPTPAIAGAPTAAIAVRGTLVPAIALAGRSLA